VKELTRGAVRLIDSDAKNLIHVAMEEIKRGKVGIENGPKIDPKKKPKKKKS
jgi:DNA-directed RNA polymerase subunit K/omega